MERGDPRTFRAAELREMWCWQLLHRWARSVNDERDSVFVLIRSAERTRAEELGARELWLESWATGLGSSSCELLKLLGSFLLMIVRLLLTGVLLREIQTPSTSMPL
jgi:hypothetical protein